MALRRALNANQPFGVTALREAIADVQPSPAMEKARAE
jgi:hypothetical protein